MNRRIPTRDGFGRGLLEAARQDNNIVALCADLADSTRISYFKNEFPERFFEMGVAEQNMASIASGLAAVGKVPFISSYAVFSPGRNWDQIRVTICYNNVNVKIAGAHAGISVGPDGATHQALEDIALMRVLPNMTVLVPADYEETRQATIAAAQHKGPVYIRFARHATPIFIKNRFKIGQAKLIHQGKRATIIAAGPVLFEALKAGKKAGCDVINCSTIKPLDKKTILQSVKKTKKVITVEEHQVAGGLGGAIAELLAEKYPVKIKRIGINDHFGESGRPEELLKKFGLTKEDIIKVIKRV